MEYRCLFCMMAGSPPDYKPGKYTWDQLRKDFVLTPDERTKFERRITVSGRKEREEFISPLMGGNAEEINSLLDRDYWSRRQKTKRGKRDHKSMTDAQRKLLRLRFAKTKGKLFWDDNYLNKALRICKKQGLITHSGNNMPWELTLRHGILGLRSEVASQILNSPDDLIEGDLNLLICGLTHTDPTGEDYKSVAKVRLDITRNFVELEKIQDRILMRRYICDWGKESSEVSRKKLLSFLYLWARRKYEVGYFGIPPTNKHRESVIEFLLDDPWRIFGSTLPIDRGYFDMLTEEDRTFFHSIIEKYGMEYGFDNDDLFDLRKRFSKFMEETSRPLLAVAGNTIDLDRGRGYEEDESIPRSTKELLANHSLAVHFKGNCHNESDLCPNSSTAEELRYLKERYPEKVFGV